MGKRITRGRLQLVLVLAAWWLHVRPGLAPELSHRHLAPWLTRTAGRPVPKPTPFEITLARFRRGIEQTRRTLVKMLTPAVQKAVEAFAAFGVAAAAAMRAADAAAAEDTAIT